MDTDERLFLIREATYTEYKNFTSEIIDKVQLAESNSVILSSNNILIVIKVPCKELVNLPIFYNSNKFIELDILHYNNGVIDDKDNLTLNTEFYKGKNFLITYKNS